MGLARSEGSFRNRFPAHYFLSTFRRKQLLLADGRITMPDPQRHYGKWTREELRQAEATASQFLEENSTQISETIRSKVKFLENLLDRLSRKNVSFEERLEYLARASEIARLIQDDADGFFDLASQPGVARILSSVRRK
jgi:hypothetical protein